MGRRHTTARQRPRRPGRTTVLAILCFAAFAGLIALALAAGSAQTTSCFAEIHRDGSFC